MSSATVTVCIPTHGRAPYLDQTLESVLQQVRTPDEVLVVDNPPCEARMQQLRRFPPGRIEYHRNPLDLGMIGNWNRCLELSHGTYVAILHDDDIWDPAMLATTVPILDSHPKIGFLFTAVRLIDGRGHITGRLDPYGRDLVLEGRTEFDALLEDNHIRCPSAVVRASCYERLGGFDGSIGHAADWEMWLRMAAHYEVAFVAAPLASYRAGYGSGTDLLRDIDGTAERLTSEAAVLERAMTYARAMDRPELVRHAAESRALRLFQLAMTDLIRGRYDNGLRSVRAGMRIQRRAPSWRQMREVIHVMRSLVWQGLTKQRRFGGQR